MSRCTKECSIPLVNDNCWDFSVVNGIIKVANALGRPATVLDVGANRGTIIENLYKHVYMDTIYAVEASSFNFNNLQKNVASFTRNDHIRLIHAAVSDNVGVVDIYSGNGTCETFNIVGSWLSNEHTHVTEEVKSTTIDYMCEKLNVIFDIIKIDVESAELLVLAGAINAINNSACTLVECHSEHLFKEVFKVAKKNDWQMLCNKHQHIIDSVDSLEEYIGHVYLVPEKSPLRQPLQHRTF